VKPDEQEKITAGVVQLVECFLAKEEVVGSSPIARSESRSLGSGFIDFLQPAIIFYLYNNAQIRFGAVSGSNKMIREKYQNRISIIMPHDLLNFYNLDPDEDIQSSLRLALMFKDEVDEATRAYMEMLQISIDSSSHSQEEVTRMVQEAINAALLTGIRAYRFWIQTQGVDVQEVEESSGKDIPIDYFHKEANWIH
jgi:hypothetical protein